MTTLTRIALHPKGLSLLHLYYLLLLNDSDTELADDMHKNKQTRIVQTSMFVSSSTSSFGTSFRELDLDKGSQLT